MAGPHANPFRLKLVALHAHTESAAEEAEALGLAATDVAKTLVVKTPEGYVRAVLPTS